MAMKKTKGTIKIDLTEDQRQQIKEAMGLDVSVIELMPEELEERVAPSSAVNLNSSKSNIY